MSKVFEEHGKSNIILAILDLASQDPCIENEKNKRKMIDKAFENDKANHNGEIHAIFKSKFNLAMNGNDSDPMKTIYQSYHITKHKDLMDECLMKLFARYLKRKIVFYPLIVAKDMTEESAIRIFGDEFSDTFYIAGPRWNLIKFYVSAHLK